MTAENIARQLLKLDLKLGVRGPRAGGPVAVLAASERARARAGLPTNHGISRPHGYRNPGR